MFVLRREKRKRRKYMNRGPAIKSLAAMISMMITVWFSALPPVYANETDELSEIRAEMQRLREAYESEIARLEGRIDEMETRQAEQAVVAEQAPPPPPAPPASRSSSAANAFNPGISVVFNGRFAAFQLNPETYMTPGFPLFGEAGPGPDGFSLGETELNLSANVNDLFYASTTIAFDASDEGTEVELEEAYIQTLKLPSGLTLKAGRFFAALGYLNENHSHTDNFSIRPLPYQVYFGGGNYNDDGVQLAVVLPTTTYIQLGGGIFRGGAYPAGGAAHDGVGAYSAFARFGGDIGFSTSWRFGLSYLHADAIDQILGPEDGGFPETLSYTGNNRLFIADFKFQWSPQGNINEKYLILQGEFFRRGQTGAYNGILYRGHDSGFYIEGVYKFTRGWRFGYRYSQLNPERNIPATLLETGLNSMGLTPRTHSLMVDWARNEFSLVRIQLSRDLSQRFADNRIFIQFIMAIGAHSAHNF